MNKFSTEELKIMNKSYPWNGTIDIKSSNNNIKYKLHATGDADLNGRKYVAIPVDTKISREIARKYNII